MREDESGYARRRRRPSIKAAEVRARMLAAATQIVYAEGVRVSLEELSLEKVIERAEVPRSSVYRLWPYKGDFIDDLLAHLAAPTDWRGLTVFDQQTLDDAAKVVEQNMHLLTTPDGRRRVMLETVRVAIKRNFDTISQSPEWLVTAALLATVRSVPSKEARARLADDLERSESAFAEAIAVFLQQITRLLGLRLKPGLTFQQLAVVGASMLEGMAHRRILTETARSTPRRDAPPRDVPWSLHDVITGEVPGPALEGAETVPWTPAAIAYVGLLDAFLEPENEADEVTSS